MLGIFATPTNTALKRPITELQTTGNHQTVRDYQFTDNSKLLSLLMFWLLSFAILGGTKLGVGGLISAYKTAAKLSLEASEIRTLDILIPFKLSFVYQDLSKVMRIIKKQQLILKSQRLEMECEVVILVKKSNIKSFETTFEAFHKIKVEILND